MDRQFPGRTARCGPEYGERLGDVIKEVPNAQSMLGWYGHHPYGLHKHLDGPCQYVTILRDPVKRVISVWQRRVNNYPSATLLDAANGIRGVHVETDTCNMATRILAGDLVRWDDDIGEAELGRAKKNLLTFAAVGFTDRYGLFAKQLRHRLGWNTVSPADIPRENVGPPQRRVTQEQIDSLDGCKNMALDRELYRWARGIFLKS